MGSEVHGEILVFEGLWDEEASVRYTSGTPIQGVLAEAPTLEELPEKLSIIIPEVPEMEKEDYKETKLPFMVKLSEYPDALGSLLK